MHYLIYDFIQFLTAETICQEKRWRFCGNLQQVFQLIEIMGESWRRKRHLLRSHAHLPA